VIDQRNKERPGTSMMGKFKPNGFSVSFKGEAECKCRFKTYIKK
jgi:hypothetical protein